MKKLTGFLMMVFVVYLSSCIGGGGGGGETTETQGEITGKAIIGNLANADVKIFKVEDNGSFTLLWTGKTSGGQTLDGIGNFNSHAKELEDDVIYVYQVCGGQDWDADDDGIKDPTPTDNNGCIRAVVLGKEVKEAGNSFIVSALTEFQYRWVVRLFRYGYDRNSLMQERDRLASRMLIQDLNGDGIINQQDIIIFNPKTDVDKLHPVVLAQGEDLIEAIHMDIPFIPRLAEIVKSINVNGMSFIDMVIDGNYAYTVWPFTVWDISDPLNPVLLKSLSTIYGGQLFKSGNYVYVVDGNDKFFVIDVSDNNNPTVVGNLSIDNSYLNDVFVSGDYAYVSDYNFGLRIIDISDKTSPSLKSSLQLSDRFYSVEGLGNIIYLGGVKLHIINVQDIDNPAELKTVSVSAYDIDIVGNYLYLSTGTLKVYDISDPVNPVYKTSVGTNIKRTHISGNTAVSGGSKVFVYDISDPTKPSEIGQYNTGNIAAIVQKDRYIYISKSIDGLDILTVISDNFNSTDFEEPVLVKRVRTIYAQGLFYEGGFLYLADSSYLKIYDVSNPDDPQGVGSVGTTTARDVVVMGDYAYVADGGSGLRIVDVTDKTNPQIKSTVDTQGSACSVSVKGNFIYLADLTSNLFYIVNVEDKDNPYVESSLDMEAMTYGVSVKGDYVLVANSNKGLRVVNVSDPSNPTIERTFDTTGSVFSVFVNGDYAYVSDGAKGLKVFDISNLPDISLVGSVDTPQYSWDAFATDDIAFVADGLGGVQVIDISNKAAPKIVENIKTQYFASRVFFANGILYISDGTKGFIVVDTTLFDEL